MLPTPQVARQIVEVIGDRPIRDATAQWSRLLQCRQ